MLLYVFAFGLLLSLGLLWGLYSASNQASQLAFVQSLVASTGPLYDLTLHLTNFGGAINNTTPLATLLANECVFQGYAPISAINPTGSYIGVDQAAHAAWADYLFESVNGVPQQMSNIAVGPITGNGSITAIVTAAGMTGSPITVNVPVLTTDSNAGVATKIVTALKANGTIAAFFPTIAASGNTVYMTANPAANDATMNIALATGTATGLTAEPTATQVTAGSAPVALNDKITGWFLTNAAGTLLVLAEPILPNVPITAPNQGAQVSPDYAYGN